MPFLSAKSQFFHRSFKAFSFASPPSGYPIYKAFQNGNFQNGDSFEVVTVFNTIAELPLWTKSGFNLQFSGVVKSNWEVKDINYVRISLGHSIKSLKTKMIVPLASPVFFDSDKKEDYKNRDNEDMSQILNNAYSISVGSDGIIKYVFPEKSNPNTVKTDSLNTYLSIVPFIDEAAIPSSGDPFNMKITLPANYAINNKWVTILQNSNEKKITSYIINQISESEVNLKYFEEETTLSKD